MMESRIVEMTFAPQDVLVPWLQKILVNGDVWVEDHNVIVFRNHDLNFGGGFCFNSDPVTKGVMIAQAIAGAGFWMHAFPGLLSAIDKRWQLERKR